MGKVYFEGDDNVYVEGRPETADFLMQYVWVYPDGKCLFKGYKCELLSESRKYASNTKEYEEAWQRYSDWLGSDKDPYNFVPEGVVAAGFSSSLGMSGKMTQEQRKVFFEANKNIFQKMVDSGFETEAGKEAFGRIDSHAHNFEPDYPEGNVWYERFPGEHRCGLTQEDFVAFVENNNIEMDPDNAEFTLGILDERMEETTWGSFTHKPEIERLGLNAEKTQIFVQLPDSVYDTESLGDDYGKMKLARYDKYTARQFLCKFLPNIGSGLGGYSNEKPPALKDPSGKVEGLSFNDLDSEWCKPTVPLFYSTDHIADRVSAMLRCFNGTAVLDDFIREFPKEAFPDFPDVPHDKYLTASAFVPDKDFWYWNTEEAHVAEEKLREHLANYAPKGLVFGDRTKNPRQNPYMVAAEKETGFFGNMGYGYKALDFLYDQVASGNHPAFRGNSVGNDGKVRVFVPKVGWASESRMQSLCRFYAAGQCAVYDPEKDKGARDFILQESKLAEHASEKVDVPVVGKEDYAGTEKENLSTVPVSFVSVPSSRERKCVIAMSSDPVDYVARFCLASKAGCDLSTTKEVMDSARKKLAGWLGRHFTAGEYYKLIDFNKKVEKREKEIVAEMREKKEEKKKESSLSAERQPSDERDGGGYVL